MNATLKITCPKCGHVAGGLMLDAVEAAPAAPLTRSVVESLPPPSQGSLRGKASPEFARARGLITIPEAGKLLGIGRSRAYVLASEGLLETVSRPGTKHNLYVRASSVEKLLKEGGLA